MHLIKLALKHVDVQVQVIILLHVINERNDRFNNDITIFIHAIKLPSTSNSYNLNPI